MSDTLPQDLQLYLDSFNYQKAEEVLDKLLVSDMGNKHLLFLRSLVAMGQYTFGSTKAKEGLAYLNRSAGLRPDVEYFRSHITHIGQSARTQLVNFVQTTSDEVKKASVGTLTDPTWKLATDTGIIKIKIDVRADDILEIVDYLMKLIEFFPGSGLETVVDTFTQYAAQNGDQLGKKINAKRTSHGYGEQSTSSCFIATAVYGSHIDPSVLVLRSYRDSVLIKNTLGRAFIWVYYRVGPHLARFVIRHRMVRGLAKSCLDEIVSRLSNTEDSRNT